MKARKKPKTRSKKSGSAGRIFVKPERAAPGGPPASEDILPRMAPPSGKPKMIQVPVEELMDRTGSIFKLCNLASKRAEELNEGAPKLVAGDSRRLALLALEEIRQGKVSLGVKEVEEEKRGRTKKRSRTMKKKRPMKKKRAMKRSRPKRKKPLVKKRRAVQKKKAKARKKGKR